MGNYIYSGKTSSRVPCALPKVACCCECYEGLILSRSLFCFSDLLAISPYPVGIIQHFPLSPILFFYCLPYLSSSESTTSRRSGSYPMTSHLKMNQISWLSLLFLNSCSKENSFSILLILLHLLLGHRRLQMAFILFFSVAKCLIHASLCYF